MADVTVKQLAQVVGIPVERLLTQLQEAGLSITDEQHVVREDQKRILLNHLKSSSSAQDAAPDRITLRRKSVSQVTVGHDAHSGKTVNVEVRKKRVFVKRAPVVELPVEIIPEEPVVDAEDTSVDEQIVSQETSDVVDAPAIDVSITDEVSIVDIEPTIVNSTDDITSLPVSEQNKTDKSAKKKPVNNESSDAAKTDFKKGKKKGKYQPPKRAENESEQSAKRSKFKRRKGNEKSEKYREAEESLTHGFAMPTAPLVHEVSIPETITVAELAKRMSVKAASVIKVMIGLGAMATINQVIDQETAIIVVEEMGHVPRLLKDDAIAPILGERNTSRTSAIPTISSLN